MHAVFFDDHRLLLSGRSGLQCDLLSVSGAAGGDLFYHNTHGACCSSSLLIPFALYSPAASSLSSMLHAHSHSRPSQTPLSGLSVRILCVLFLTRTCMEYSFAHCTDSRDAH